jgi:hypothetical protein
MIELAYLFLFPILLLLSGALFLKILPRLGNFGKTSSDFFCHVPGLDLALAYFTLLPPIVESLIAGWRGFGVSLAAQIVALWLWILIDEFVHRDRWQEAKIYRVNSQIVGSWRNFLALNLTTLAIPAFWAIRLAQIVVYPPLTKLVKFPKYEAREWINVSRHKFDGLVGFDLVWCLYCDWMTGLWSLGTEMLRNLESFWCPIRFQSAKKCANCQRDFPDLDRGWIAANGTIEEVAELIWQKHSNVEECSWFGHPSRK